VTGQNIVLDGDTFVTGDFEVGSANIADLAVDTIKVADRAITFQVSGESFGGSTQGTSWVTVSSLNFASVGFEEALVGASFDWARLASGGTGAVYVRLLFNGNVVREVADALEGDSGIVGTTDLYNLIGLKPVVAGANLLELQVRVATTSFLLESEAENVTLFALIARK